MDRLEEINNLNRLYKDAEYCFMVAEFDVVDGTYFPTDPTKKKIPDSIRRHNKNIKRENFISAKTKIIKIRNEYLSTLKPFIHQIKIEDRKELMKNRYKMEKMIKSCDHYIELFSDKECV